MTQQLAWLSANAPAWAARRAQQAIELSQLHAAGELSLSEYQALMQDLVHMDRLNAEADDLEIKNYLVAAVMIGAKLV
jgi:hypothetical protein